MKKNPPFTALRVRLDLPTGGDRLRKALPFKRAWIAILVIAAIDIVFTIPAIITFQDAAKGWGDIDSLFDLSHTLFLSSWLLGWSIAPIILTLILVAMLLGREVLTARQGVVCIGIGIHGLLVEMEYEASRMRNLRHVYPDEQSGTSWRGPHLVFDYGSHEITFGSAINENQVAEIASHIEMATGMVIRKGESTPEELAEEARAEEKTIQKQQPAEYKPPAPVNAVSVTLSSPSILALIIANLVPVVGTIFLGWQLSDVMVLYWAESTVVGFFNLIKMAFIGRWFVLLTGPLFVGHFGAFMAIHFLFIYEIFVKGINSSNSGGDLLEVAQLFVALWPALLALFVSHGISFFNNFLARGEYRNRTIGYQMNVPYSRIIFMHMVLIFGGGLTIFLGEPTPVLLIVIALKIHFDIKAHIRERGTASNPDKSKDATDT